MSDTVPFTYYMERIKRGLTKIKEKRNRIQREIKEKMVGYIVAALGLIAGLAWNDAVKSLIDQLYPRSGGIFVKFVYAFLITIIIVIATVSLVRLIEKEEQKS